MRKITETKGSTVNEKPTHDFKSTAVLSYIKGASEILYRCLQQHYQVRPEDPIELAKRDGVFYKIPCECSKVYIGETGKVMKDYNK